MGFFRKYRFLSTPLSEEDGGGFNINQLDEQEEILEVGKDMNVEQVIVAELNIEEVLSISIIKDVHAVLGSDPAIDIDEAVGEID